MFSHLIDFEFKRTTKQAVGFYIVYLLVTVLLAAVVGDIYGRISGHHAVSPEDEYFFETAQVGAKVVMAVVLAVSILILKAKRRLRDTRSIFNVILAAAFTFVGGGLLGFIIVARMTTLGLLKKEPLKKAKKAKEI